MAFGGGRDPVLVDPILVGGFTTHFRAYLGIEFTGLLLGLQCVRRYVFILSLGLPEGKDLWIGDLWWACSWQFIPFFGALLRGPTVDGRNLA